VQLRCLAIALASTVVLLPAGTAGGQPAQPPSYDAGQPTPGESAIPLITGDTVEFGPDGLARLRPGPGRDTTGFVSPSASDGSADLIVVPSDAAPPLAAGLLDERLFNVSALARQGYQGADELPVLVQDAHGARSTTVTTEDAAGYWKQFLDEVGATTSAGDSGASKLWLDDATDRPSALPGDSDGLTAPQPADGASHVRVHVSRPGGGSPSLTKVNLQSFDTADVYYLQPEGPGVVSGDVPPGRYCVLAYQQTASDGSGSPGTFALTYDTVTVSEESLEWNINGDDLQPMEFQVDRADARLHHIEMKLQVSLPEFGFGMSYTSIQLGDWQGYTQPTGDAGLAFTVRPTLTDEPDANGDTDYSYHLVFDTDNGVPSDLSFEAADPELAKRTMRYETRGDSAPLLRDSYGKIDSAHNSGFVVPELPISAPDTLTEFYTPGERVEWFHIGDMGDQSAPDSFARYGGYYEPGKTAATWGDGPMSAGLVPSRFPYAMNRSRSDWLNGITPLFSGPDPAEINRSRAGVTGVATLSCDGAELARNERKPQVHNYYVPPDATGELTLEVELERASPWSELGTAASAAWTFHSESTGSSNPVDMATVAMDATGISGGYASSRLPQLVSFDVQRQGRDADTQSLRFEVSYDDGKTWWKVPVARAGDHALAMLFHPPRAEYVSVKLSEKDSLGNTFTQTTIRSYGLH
jgi:hypothetical protein